MKGDKRPTFRLQKPVMLSPDKQTTAEQLVSEYCLTKNIK